jgi:hypothetical protein
MAQPKLRADSRGQAIAIGEALLGLCGFGIIFGFAYVIWNPLYAAGSDEVTNSTAQEGLDYTQQLFEALPFLFLMIAVIGVIALSVYQSQGGR